MPAFTNREESVTTVVWQGRLPPLRLTTCRPLLPSPALDTMDTKALDKPVTSKDVERRSNAHFQSAAACLTGYRPSNEDAHVLDLQPKHATVGVFDGHGGPRCAAYLAKHVPPLVASLGPPVPDQKLEEALVQMDQKYVTTCTAGAGGSTAAFFVAMPRGDDEYDVQVSALRAAPPTCVAGSGDLETRGASSFIHPLGQGRQSLARAHATPEPAGCIRLRGIWADTV